MQEIQEKLTHDDQINADLLAPVRHTLGTSGDMHHSMLGNRRELSISECAN